MKVEKTALPQVLDNRIVIDYLTFVSKCDSERSIIKLLGLDNLEFEEYNTGFYGYQKSLRYDNNIIILYGGHSYWSDKDDKMITDNNICFQMSGNGCRTFEDVSDISFMDLFEYLYDNKEDYNITRLDIAYDDFENLLDINVLFQDMIAQNYSSRTRFYEFCGGSNGLSLYFGSPDSEFRLRIYDKASEQKIFDGQHWVRVEMQLRKDRAISAVDYINSGLCIDEVYFNILNNYLRFVTPCGDKNKSRWKTAPYWEKFLKYHDKISLYVEPGNDYNSLKLMYYVEKQCAPSLATYCANFGLLSLLKLVFNKSQEIHNSKYTNLLFKNNKDFERLRFEISRLLGDELYSIEGLNYDRH